jgi:hypothetical protein
MWQTQSNGVIQKVSNVVKHVTIISTYQDFHGYDTYICLLLLPQFTIYNGISEYLKLYNRLFLHKRKEY